MIYVVVVVIIMSELGIIIWQAKRIVKVRTQRDNFADSLHKSERFIKATDIANKKYKDFWAKNHSDPNTIGTVTGLRGKKNKLTHP